MTRGTVAIVLAIFALSACKPRSGEAPATHDSMDQEAIKALGSAVPMNQFDSGYWQRLHDSNTPEWQQAKRLCQQTILANYPNCLPVNDIVQAEQRKKAVEGNKAAAKIEEMGREGYSYDYRRHLWLPDREMLSAGCTSVPAFPGNPKRIGFYTWQCPSGTLISQGIPDETFSEEEEDATN